MHPYVPKYICVLANVATHNCNFAKASITTRIYAAHLYITNKLHCKYA